MKFAPRGAVVILGLVAVIVVGMLIPFPPGNWLIIALLNMAHAPAFAVLTVCVMRFGRTWDASQTRWSLTAMLVFFGMAVLGIATEYMQGFAGRQPSWDDLRADMAGTIVGLFWSMRLRATDRKWIWSRLFIVPIVSVLLIAAVSQYSVQILLDMALGDHTPGLLASFETKSEMTRWYGASIRAVRTRELFCTQGEYGIVLQFNPGPEYASFTLARMPRDWSAYERFVFDVFITGGAQTIFVKIHDVDHNDEPSDRFGQRLQLLPGAQRVEIPLSRVRAAPKGRTMGMDRIKHLSVFTRNIKQPVVIGIDHLRLE